MKKFLFFIYFLFIYNLSFSYYINDYILFKECVNLYENEEYSKAEIKFRSLEKSYPSSNLVKSNYYAYFMALNYYSLGNVDKAIFYMQKSVYTPKNLKGRNFFLLDRNYYLGKFFYEKGDIDSATPYLTQLVNIDYSPTAKNYESYALNILKNHSSNFKILYDIKFKNDFSQISIPSSKELLKVTKYFLDREEFEHALKVISYLYTKESSNETVILYYLHTLYSLNMYDEVVKISSKMLEEVKYPIVFYFRGKSLIKTKAYTSGIFNLETAMSLENKHSRTGFLNDARETLLNTYFALNSYDDIIAKCKEFEPLNKEEQLILINSYFKKKDYANALSLSDKFVKNYPFTPHSIYLYYLLKEFKYKVDDTTAEKFNNISELPTLRLMSIVSNTYLYNLNSYKLNLKEEFKNPELSKLFKIAELEDINLIHLEVENSSKLSYDPTINEYLITKILDNSKNYGYALENSRNNTNLFSKYKNLIPLLYPKYYTDEVNKASKKYDIPDNLLYTAIYLSSKYKQNYAGSMYKIGLMQIQYNPVEISDYTLLTDPNYNIDLGSKRLASLIRKNNSNIKGLIEYLYGEKVLNSIHFENEDFYINNISDATIKKQLTEFAQAYVFYKILYN